MTPPGASRRGSDGQVAAGLLGPRYNRLASGWLLRHQPAIDGRTRPPECRPRCADTQRYADAVDSNTEPSAADDSPVCCDGSPGPLADHVGSG